MWAQSLCGILLGLGFIAVTAGVTFRIDEVVTVRGQLESVNGNVDLKTPAGGKVAEVLVGEGSTVKKGDLLLKFDTRQASEDLSTITRLIRLEDKDLKSRIDLLTKKKAVLLKKLSTTSQIVGSLKLLVDQGGFQKVQYLQQLDQLFELETQLGNVTLDIQRETLDSEKKLGQLKNQLLKARLQLQYQNVVAPASGIIFNLKSQESGVLQAGETILSIIPQGRLKAKVYVTNKDIGFVKLNQPAKVRVDAFPFTRYGELIGTVDQIGADALEPDATNSLYRYPVTLKLDDDNLYSKGVKIPLRTGMAITVNLKLREKRLISLLSDMLVDQTDSVRSIRQQ